MLKEIEFKIKNRPDVQFKFTGITAPELLSINTKINFGKDGEQDENVFTFVLEHAQVKIGNEWFPVKEKNMDVYYPVDIEEDIVSLYQIFTTFVDTIVIPVFKKSRELSQSQQ